MTTLTAGPMPLRSESEPGAEARRVLPYRLLTRLLALPYWVLVLGSAVSFQATLWAMNSNDIPLIGGAVTTFLTVTSGLVFKYLNDRKEQRRLDREEDRKDKELNARLLHDSLGVQVAVLQGQVATLTARNVQLERSQQSAGRRSERQGDRATAASEHNAGRIDRMEDAAARKDASDATRDDTLAARAIAQAMRDRTPDPDLAPP